MYTFSPIAATGASTKSRHENASAIFTDISAGVAAIVVTRMSADIARGIFDSISDGIISHLIILSRLKKIVTFVNAGDLVSLHVVFPLFVFFFEKEKVLC